MQIREPKGIKQKTKEKVA